MPTYKNIRVPKRGGGTRMQRVQVLASGQYKFVKNLSKSNPSRGKTTTKRKTTLKKGGRNMAKGKSLYKSMVKIAKVAALVLPPIVAYKRYGNIADPVLVMTGYNMSNGKWEPTRLMQGWGPFVGLTVAEKIVSKINGILRGL